VHSKHVCVPPLYAGSHHAVSQRCAQPRPRNLVNVSLAVGSHLSIGQVPCRLHGGAQCHCLLLFPKFVVSRIAQGPLPVSHPIRHHNVTHCTEVRYCKLLVRHAQVCVSSGLLLDAFRPDIMEPSLPPQHHHLPHKPHGTPAAHSGHICGHICQLLVPKTDNSAGTD
jgi:hypothetical protein